MHTTSYFYVISTLLCTLSGIVLSSSSNHDTDRNTFYTVKNITSLVFGDADWFWERSLISTNWYMPLMSRNAAKQLSEFIGGGELAFSHSSTTKPRAQFCPRQILKEPFGIFSGFDGRTEAVKYVKTDPLVRGAFNFTFFSETKGNRKGSLACSLTDNSSYIVIIRVWENHECDWIVLSVGTEISPEKQSDIINHVKVLGLDVDNVTWNDYTECDYRREPESKLKWKKFKNICRNVPQKPQINFQKVENFMKGSNFMPLMSTSASQTVAQFLTGKPMKKITKNFCPVSTWDLPDGYMLGFQYYRNVFTTSYSGKYANNSAWLFELEPKYPTAKVQNKRAVILPVWTDFRNYLLMISCWQDGNSDWILYSKRKLLDQYTQKFILSKVGSIGFDTNDVFINKYTHCTD